MVVIHCQDGVKLSLSRLSEHGVRNMGAGEHTGKRLIQSFDRWRNDPGLLVTEASVLAGMRIKTRDRNPRGAIESSPNKRRK